MLIAEGSDWFWWYGDDHSSEHDLEFDGLFRRHVRNVYKALEKPIPEELFVTNITTAPPAASIQSPTGFVQPEIDGQADQLFRMGRSGLLLTGSSTAGAMHQVAERPAGRRRWWSSVSTKRTSIIRVDGSIAVRQMLAGGFSLSVRFVKPSGLRILVADVRRGRDGGLPDA